MPRQSSDIWGTRARRVGYMRSIRLVEQLCRRRPGFLGYRDLRINISGTKCFELQDMIYTLSSLLCEPDKRSGIQPDYSKSVAEVYTDVVRRTISEHHSLKILTACELSSRVLGIPSWVPDWSSPFKTTKLAPGGRGVPAAGYLHGSVTQCSQEGVLCFEPRGLLKFAVRPLGTTKHIFTMSRWPTYSDNSNHKWTFDAPYKSSGGGAFSRHTLVSSSGWGLHMIFDPRDTYWPEFHRTVQDLRTI
jgi:hypothetical protein